MILDNMPLAGSSLLSLISLLAPRCPDWTSQSTGPSFFQPFLRQVQQWRVYRWGGYSKFCREASLTDLLISEHKVMLYSRELAPGTIKSYLAAVCYHQISFSEMLKLEYLMKG